MAIPCSHKINPKTDKGHFNPTKKGLLKHRKVLNAWLDGEKIQYCSPPSGHWFAITMPEFKEESEYRIAPTPIEVELWVNVYPDNRPNPVLIPPKVSPIAMLEAAGSPAST